MQKTFEKGDLIFYDDLCIEDQSSANRKETGIVLYKVCHKDIVNDNVYMILWYTGEVAPYHCKVLWKVSII